MNTQAKLIAISVSPGGIPKLPVESVRVMTEHLEGDGRDHAKHNSPSRAVSLIDDEILADLRVEGYAVNPGSMGENLTVRGLNLQKLMPGTCLRFSGGVEIELTEPRKPCFVLDAIDPKLKDVVVGRCGYMASVVREGVLRTGEAIEVISA